MPKLTLDNRLVEEAFFEGQCLTGIAAPAVPDYRFCWMLNHYLGMRFERCPDLDVVLRPTPGRQPLPAGGLFAPLPQKPSSRIFFPVYRHENRDSGLSVLLYGNRCAADRLIKEVKGVDFFMLLPDNPFMPELERIKTCDRLQGVLWMKEIDLQAIPSKAALIL